MSFFRIQYLPESISPKLRHIRTSRRGAMPSSVPVQQDLCDQVLETGRRRQYRLLRDRNKNRRTVVLQQ